jgi:hypothetical protein
MQKKGSHIFRSLIVMLVMSGLAAHLAAPFSSHAQKTAFTRWLGNNISDSGSEKEIHLRKSIQKLPDQSEDLWVLIQQASRLIADNSDTFELPINKPVENSESENETRLTNWLLNQWERYQHQSSGFNLLLPDSQKISIKWTFQSVFTGSVLSSLNNFFSNHAASALFSADQLISLHTIPHLSGISINAP